MPSPNRIAFCYHRVVTISSLGLKVLNLIISSIEHPMRNNSLYFFIVLLLSMKMFFLELFRANKCPHNMITEAQEANKSYRADTHARGQITGRNQ